MPDKTFLETYPLYRPFKVAIATSLDSIPKPTLNYHCPFCESLQSYVMSNEYYVGHSYKNFPSPNQTVKAEYTCISCKAHRIDFFLHFSADLKSVTKVGQAPPWSIEANKDIEKLLGAHREYLRRGQICESQGYGIGAFAYYRRIVEEVIDLLLDKIPALLSAEELSIYQVALERTKTTRIAAEKIELVKDLMPPILRPSGINPLKALHEALSEGLHSQSDEECLELSAIIRDALVFLATQINTSTAAASSFTQSMRKLLEKKSERN